MASKFKDNCPLTPENFNLAAKNGARNGCWCDFCELFLRISKLTELRYLILILGIAITATSCSSLRSTTQSRTVGQQPPVVFAPAPEQQSQDDDRLPAMPESKKAPKIVFIPHFNIEHGEVSQFKYAIKMDVEVERLANAELYNFIEQWWGAPYRLGGSTRKGIDCSAFTQTLLSSIYDVKVPRTASEQKTSSNMIQPEDLKEGDLVFFITRGKGISHVGIYLHDNKFVHASTSSGVTISSLNDTYWSKKYAGAGRVVEEKFSSPLLSSSR